MSNIWILPLGSVFLVSGSVYAGVSACVLDGGGTIAQRTCGADRAVKKIHEVYTASGTQEKLQILSGPGLGNGDPECSAPLMRDDDLRRGPVAVQKAEYNSKTDGYEMKDVSVKRGVSFGKLGPPFSGTPESFDKNCFFDSARPPRPKLEVCHFWNINHGAPEGSVFFTPNKDQDPKFLSPETLSKKAEGCETFRFVTNACYGAQLSKVILDKNGRVIAGRCGMSASPPGFQSEGTSTLSPERAIEVKDQFKGPGRLHQRAVAAKPLDNDYPLIEQFSSHAAEKRKGQKFAKFSLDGVYSNASVEQDGSLLLGHQPYLTSDFFLGHTLGNEFKNAQSTDNSLYSPMEADRVKLIEKVTAPHQQDIDGVICRDKNRDFGNISAFMKDVLSATEGKSLSPSEKQWMETELHNEVARLRAAASLTCYRDNSIKVAMQMKSDLSEKRPSFLVEQEQGMKIHELASKMDCNVEGSYQEFSKERTELIENLKSKEAASARQRGKLEEVCQGMPVAPCAVSAIEAAIRDAIRRGKDFCAGTAGCASGPDNLMRLRDRLVDRLQAVSKAATEAEKDEANTAARLDGFLKGDFHFRQYENAKMRFAQVVQLMKKGTSEQLQDYKVLRSCEAGDFNGKVVK
ncbi:hypothetical protein WDW86_03605 [Bdellovibrionota bacterium FG-2]